MIYKKYFFWITIFVLSTFLLSENIFASNIETETDSLDSAIISHNNSVLLTGTQVSNVISIPNGIRIDISGISIFAPNPVDKGTITIQEHVVLNSAEPVSIEKISWKPTHQKNSIRLALGNSTFSVIKDTTETNSYILTASINFHLY